MATNFEPPKVHTSKKDHLYYDYCGKMRHINETCWKLHGCLTKGRGGKRRTTNTQANFTEAIEESPKVTISVDFSFYKIQGLKCFLSQLDCSSITTSNFVKLGNAFVSHRNTASCIIDSGANRYMIDSSKDFLNYSPCLNQDKTH